MNNFFQDKSHDFENEENTLIKLLMIKLKKILLNCPKIYYFLKKGFEIEIESLSQKNNNEYNHLIEIENNKSKIFVDIFYIYLFGKENIEYPKELGILGQLLDDFCDYEEDKSNGVNTLITYHIKNNNPIQIYLMIFEIIDKLPDNFFISKLASVLLLQYKLNYHDIGCNDLLLDYTFDKSIKVSNYTEKIYNHLQRYFT